MPDFFTGIEMLTATWSKEREFRFVMMRLAEELKSDEFEKLKYALGRRIPAGRMERFQGPLDVFRELEQRNLVAPGKLEFLRELLEDIGRPHLISMVDEFDDSCSAFPLKPKSENYLEMDGYRLSIKGGRHFETSEGEFVEVKSGANYALTITNMNCHRCMCKMKIDSYEIFHGSLLLRPRQEWIIERPPREKKKFKFFAIADAPAGSGINKWRRDRNGLIEVVFTPEKADMKITCVAKGQETQVLSCSFQTTDSDFHEMVSDAFGATSVTIMQYRWKPLRNRGIKLFDYGIRDRTRVEVNLGGRGGVSATSLPSIENRLLSKKNPEWIAGATTLEDKSKQNFMMVKDFPLNEELAVSLRLRLVARADEPKGFPSTGIFTPLARGTLIPPPVPI